ncbi:MAG: lamin tail domain-containing protein [Myxococcales bacterium]|nr:lamin tail domain-containing protein [Myxococcales bacterium]
MRLIVRLLALPAVLAALVSCGVPHEKAPYASRVQALSNDVVISEVYGGGGGSTGAYRFDFVELFNRGSATVSLNGWSIQYASDTGGSWSVATLSGSIQPGRYFLVRMGTTGSAGQTLPTPDDTGMIAMSGTAGKIALVNRTTGLSGACPNSTSIVDLVGYGANTNCSEGMSTPNTTASSSVRRGGNGCFETDNNRNDFTVGTPTPKNATAAAINCANMPNDGGVVIIPGDGGCTFISTWPTVDSAAGYQPSNTTAGAELYTQVFEQADGGMQILSFEAYFGATPPLMLPATRAFAAGDTYGNCELCAILSGGCDDVGTCTEDYFAQGGSGTVTVATEDEGAGRFEGTLTNVRFVAWDFQADEALPSGACFVVGSTQFSVAWDTDAGMGGGSAGGGSAGGGRAGGTAGGGAAGGGSAGGSAVGGGTSSAGGTASTGGGTARLDGGMGGGGNLTTKKACGCSTGADAMLAQVLAGLLVLRVTRRRRS